MYFGRGEEAVNAADEASTKALEFGPDLSDAHASRGFALFLRNEFEQAEYHLHRAIDLDPHLYDPHYIAARVCFSQGRMADAVEHFKEACGIVPEAFDAWYLLGMCYRRLDQPGRARRADFECIEAVQRRVRSHPDDTRAWTMGAAVLVEMGEPERAGKWIEHALAVDADEPIIEYNAACVYTALGRFDDALKCLGVAAGQGGLLKSWARNDPDLDPLRSDPRFKAVLGDPDDSAQPGGRAPDLRP
jgi:adenylate cyclase